MIVAAFDFDGTLTQHDSLLPFLRQLRGSLRLTAALLRHGPELALMLAGRGDRDEVKAALLSDVLAGVPLEEAAGLGERYAEELVGRLRPDALARLREHQALGHVVVIVSASPAIYLRPLAQRLGVDDVLATELEVAGGVLTGRLDGGNCRAAEKERRLRAWLAGREVVVHAYGDSDGDRELLAMADHAYWVKDGLPPLVG